MNLLSRVLSAATRKLAEALSESGETSSNRLAGFIVLASCLFVWVVLVFGFWIIGDDTSAKDVFYYGLPFFLGLVVSFFGLKSYEKVKTTK